jgi:hypothetical protein
MLNFDERDLVRHPEQAGFADIDLELRVTVKPHHVIHRADGGPTSLPNLKDWCW